MSSSFLSTPKDLNLYWLWPATTNIIKPNITWLTKKLNGFAQKKSNVIFMQKKSIIIDGIKVLGTTLWSYIPESKKKAVKSGLNDYTLISLRTEEGKIRTLSVDDTVKWHEEELNWLTGELETARILNQPCIVITHHTPSMDGTSDQKYNGSDQSYAFSTRLTHLMGPNILVWGCGHTHHSFDFKVSGTRLVSNQRGYPFGTYEVTGYDIDKVITVDYDITIQNDMAL
eukprot:NODE_5682_length_983_cov_38.389535_g5103_i0.p1 GENE.NODE_5682_length_983_cov_38.389535_g5103_i0~~NODE_5682_length_983_cov_38.389535_g5103_i0.p1  ORF type:complete len:228 (+),score=26.50 NODE_5682_length_983_cov_38.389535_g5103_i0:152-835(+)